MLSEIYSGILSKIKLGNPSRTASDIPPRTSYGIIPETAAGISAEAPSRILQGFFFLDSSKSSSGFSSAVDSRSLANDN